MKLMQHQLDALDFLSNRNQAGLFFEMGLGKTLVLLEHLSRLLAKNEKPFPCLIICPLSVVTVWKREVEKFSYPFKVKLVIGSYEQRLNALSEEADIYVINYDGIRIIPDHLKKKNFSTLILDESHRIKERTAQQTEIALSLSKTIPFRFILTGTPVTKSPEDIWTQIQFIKPYSLGNFYSFRAEHVEYKLITIKTSKGSKNIKKALRFKNLAGLTDKVKEVCLRRTKAECLDLPPKIYKTIYCEMKGDQEKHYHNIKNTLVTMIENKQLTTANAAVMLQKLQQVCQGFLYGDMGDPIYFKENAKLAMLKDLINDLSNEKLIIFCWFKADLDLLHKTLSKDHKVILYGGNAVERGEKEKEFQESTEPVIFLSQIETGKEGITLTASNNVIYYGNSWNYGTRKQSEDRAHRTGQNKTVLYYDFIIPETVDEYVQRVLTMKGDMADKITEDKMRLAKMVAGKERGENGNIGSNGE